MSALFWILNFVFSKKAAAGVGFISMGVAVASYTDYRLKEHTEAQEKINDRIYQAVVTVNQNLFLVQLGLQSGRRQELKEIEDKNK